MLVQDGGGPACDCVRGVAMMGVGCEGVAVMVQLVIVCSQLVIVMELPLTY